MIWEYETRKVSTSGMLGGIADIEELRDVLNQMGSERWELVSAFDTNYAEGGSREIVLIFKRPR